jgi:hypothetical protein
VARLQRVPFENQEFVCGDQGGVITLIIFGLIMVVAYFARQKITSWRTYAAIYAGTLSAA